MLLDEGLVAGGSFVRSIVRRLGVFVGLRGAVSSCAEEGFRVVAGLVIPVGCLGGIVCF